MVAVDDVTMVDRGKAGQDPVLVTGARGFLGQFVMEEARRRGRTALEFGPTRFPSGDVEDRVRAVVPGTVIHLAGPSSIAGSLDDPYADFVGIVDGTAALLNALCKHAPHARVVFVSSAAVYGEPVSLPLTENARTLPLSPYGYHKLMAELLVEEASRVRGAWGAIARVFSAYGAGLRRQVVYDVCTRAARGEPLVMDGTGDESRDFVHASDVACAILTIAENAPGTAARYNVASGVETPIRDLANLVARHSGGPRATFTGRVRLGDPKCWRADISALRGLGFSPKIALDDGIREVLAWLAGAERRSGQVL